MNINIYLVSHYPESEYGDRFDMKILTNDINYTNKQFLEHCKESGKDDIFDIVQFLKEKYKYYKPDLPEFSV